MKRILLLVGVLFLLASCTTEFDQLLNGSRSDKARQTTVFQASVEGCSMPDTKVYADENLKVLWNADDRISIFNKTTFNYQFAFTGDDGDTAGSFEEIPTSDFITGTEIDNIYAVYPYDKKNKLSNSCVLTVTLPSEQAYKESSFGIGANTMVAASSGNFLAFKNVGGYLNLRLYGDDVSVSRITIKGNNGEKIAGKASIEMPLGGVPTVTMDNSATDEISVVCNPAVKIGSDANNYTDFWFVIPPVYFSLGFTIMVTDDKGGVFERATSKALTINRNTLEWMAALKVVPNYDNVIVQFEDANFKAYCVDNFDMDGDGEISMAEANAVTEINVNTEIVASLKGIEYFKNLKSLTCRLNYYSSRMINGERHYYNANNEEIFSLLTSLDISHNTALTYLNCNDNQLTSLDVSHNTALSYLSCDSNQLTSLDVSKNIALTTLDCGPNQLTDLDVSQNTALMGLSCEGNRLRSLDLSHNIELFNFACSNNLLTALDVSNNTKLNGLHCSSNQLTSLDVSNNAALYYLSCDYNQLITLDVGNNTALTSLNCGSNQLTSLDVSNNPELTHIGCDANQLTSLDIHNNISLNDINCNNNQIAFLDVSNNLLLTHLSCAENLLTDLDLSNNVELSYLHCFTNQLSTLDVSGNPKLNTLRCVSNPLLTVLWLMKGQTISTLEYDSEVTTIKYKESALDDNIHFTDVEFKAYCVENFDKDGDGEISMAEANAVTTINVNPEIVASLKGIEYFKNLRSLTCSLQNNSACVDSDDKWHYYQNGEEVFSKLTSMDLSHNTALTYLNCDSNNLTNLDVSHNTALIELHCSTNQFTSLDVSHNTALTTLNCSFNQLMSLDVSNNMALTNLRCYSNQLMSLNVSGCIALTNLDCRGNQLTGLDVSHNTALRYLSCSSNQLISLDVSHNTALYHLSCDYNQLSSLDMSNNTSLTLLWCDDNQLTALDVSNNTLLTQLHCMDNQLTSLDVSHNTALTDLWCGKNQLTVLDVSYNTGLTRLYCESMKSLTDIWFLVGQTIERMRYDEGVATIHYRE